MSGNGNPQPVPDAQTIRNLSMLFGDRTMLLLKDSHIMAFEIELAGVVMPDVPDGKVTSQLSPDQIRELKEHVDGMIFNARFQFGVNIKLLDLDAEDIMGLIRPALATVTEEAFEIATQDVEENENDDG
jgi:hypothetical protein